MAHAQRLDLCRGLEDTRRILLYMVSMRMHVENHRDTSRDTTRPKKVKRLTVLIITLHPGIEYQGNALV